MAARRRFSVIRDPVHGDVHLTDEEMRILDTPQMQRLRGIRQLGTAYLVFPGALHTRFDHSIGSLHMARTVIESVNRNFELDPAGSVAIGEEEARVVRIAALVHDVTHVPFGHSIEDQDGIFGRHDLPHRFQAMLGRGTRLGQVLLEMGVANDVLAILEANDRARTIPACWRQIVGGTLASDILDYLARDAYFTGLKLAVDPRITGYLKVDRATQNLYVDLSKHDLLREDILSEVVRLLEARYHFSERVYYHHAKVAAGALIARAVETALACRAVQESDFAAETDASVLDLLERRVERAPREARDRVRDLVARFRERRLPKRACVFPAYENRAQQESLVARFFAPGGARARQDLEVRVQDLVRFATGRTVDVIVYCPARAMQLKEARMHVRWPGVPSVAPLSQFQDRVRRLADLEASYRNLWKFYVFADAPADVLPQVAEIAAAELAPAVNAYHPRAG
jgi:HD superfamily phosphohydrolase